MNFCSIRIFFCGRLVNHNGSARARALIDDLTNELFFSPVSLWEVVNKRRLGRHDFKVDARLLRRGLLDNGYYELPIISEHVVALEREFSHDFFLLQAALLELACNR